MKKLQIYYHQQLNKSIKDLKNKEIIVEISFEQQKWITSKCSKSSVALFNTTILLIV